MEHQFVTDMKNIAFASIVFLVTSLCYGGTVRVVKQIGLEGSSGNYLTVTDEKPAVLSDVTPDVRDCSVIKREKSGTTIGILRCNQKGAPDVSTMCISGKEADSAALKNTGILIFGNSIDINPITDVATPAVPVVVIIHCTDQ